MSSSGEGSTRCRASEVEEVEEEAAEAETEEVKPDKERLIFFFLLL